VRREGALAPLRWLLRAEPLPLEPEAPSGGRLGAGGFLRWLVASDALPLEPPPKAVAKSLFWWLFRSETLPLPPETGGRSDPTPRK